jgi:hypothetical protein
VNRTRYARLLKVGDRFRYYGWVYEVTDPVTASLFGDGNWVVPVGNRTRISFLPDARVALSASTPERMSCLECGYPMEDGECVDPDGCADTYGYTNEVHTYPTWGEMLRAMGFDSAEDAVAYARHLNSAQQLP